MIMIGAFGSRETACVIWHDDAQTKTRHWDSCLRLIPLHGKLVQKMFFSTRLAIKVYILRHGTESNIIVPANSLNVGRFVPFPKCIRTFARPLVSRYRGGAGISGPQCFARFLRGKHKSQSFHRYSASLCFFNPFTTPSCRGAP